jgi:hypothetical protein
MPKEVRYILFEHDEVAAALRDHSAELSWYNETPSAQLGWQLRLLATDCGGVAAQLFKPARPGGTEELREIARGALESALLGFCKTNHIPLPVRSHKMFELMGGRVALIATLNTHAEKTVVEAAPGVLRYSDKDTEALRSRETARVTAD